MRTRTATERMGEFLGPVEWSYPFEEHFTHGFEESRREQRDRAVATLRLLSNNPGQYEATTDGGQPRCGWGRVLSVGMYDGWPYWRPVPSVQIASWSGASWHSFDSITDVRLAAISQ